jgi:hypothetical protein
MVRSPRAGVGNALFRDGLLQNGTSDERRHRNGRHEQHTGCWDSTSAEMTWRSGERTRTRDDAGGGPASLYLSAPTGIRRMLCFYWEKWLPVTHAPWDKGMIEPKSHGK